MNGYTYFGSYLHYSTNFLTYLHIDEDEMYLDNEYVNCLLDHLVNNPQMIPIKPRMKPKKIKTLMVALHPA